MDFKNKIIVIGGQTASGKTSMSLDICQQFNGEVVSSDSVQIYKYLDIGSAKPSLSERAIIEHSMIDIVEPCKEFDVKEYTQKAEICLDNIWKKNKIPVLTGGTGFYVESLLCGLPKIKNDCDIRKKYENILKEKGREYLFSILQRKWPERAITLHINDTKRIIRSIEIYETGGKEQFENFNKKLKFDILFFYIEPEKELNEKNIKKRVLNMIKNGLIDEVEFVLREKGFSRQSKTAIGYKETIDFIESNNNIEELVFNISLHTRQFAKRQRTFFKNKFKKMIFLESYDINNYHIKKETEKFLEGNNV
ncbi:MAG: tRNA (adenosine(37)-N6)-dimethylallyltransferase MiaA [Candidatus Muirbacterium halophilum]|nr:tRNA (adenosine(37)-N6)-dimethylallyltransferase MiaA [Candidatus Muirbacterium halophilum]MCK9475447.1 tRNA (adenosine(37)-N6)-dimethylallyltransferase MiaA [Candidatus Muirbacterium halophilum]